MANFTAGAVLTASALNTAFNTQTINAQTGTSYTFGTADAGELVTLSNASGGTATIPANSTWGAATGTEVDVVNVGAGTWTIGTAAGVTINGTVSVPTNGRVKLLKTATNTWYSSAMDAAVAIPTPGLTLISPTSIANSGGSASASGGAVTFTGVTSVSLNGVFSATYQHYAITVAGDASPTSATGLRFRLRTSGTDATGTNYLVHENYVTDTAGPSRSYANSVTSGEIGFVASVCYSSVAYIFRPFDASRTTYSSQSFAAGSSNNLGAQTYGLHDLATSYDGITIFGNSGTITGTIRVYGYKN